MFLTAHCIVNFKKITFRLMILIRCQTLLLMKQLVHSIKCDHTNDGKVMMQGHRCRVKLKWKDLCDYIHRVDHEYTQQRRSCTIQRRVDSTEHPNSVWHINGQHKLIRWRFITHASIVGFSRTITYIRCTNNN